MVIAMSERASHLRGNLARFVDNSQEAERLVSAIKSHILSISEWILKTIREAESRELSQVEDDIFTALRPVSRRLNGIVDAELGVFLHAAHLIYYVVEGDKKAENSELSAELHERLIDLAEDLRQFHEVYEHLIIGLRFIGLNVMGALPQFAERSPSVMADHEQRFLSVLENIHELLSNPVMNDVAEPFDNFVFQLESINAEYKEAEMYDIYLDDAFC